MQTMSAEMAALLKSGKQIGDNRPVAEVVIGGGSIYNWLYPTDTIYPDSVATVKMPSFTILANGNVLYMYSYEGDLYQNTIDDIGAFIGGDDTATTRGSAILTGKDYLDACVFMAPDGELYFVASYLQSGTDQLAKVEIYHSDLGDGSDWSLHSLVYSYDWSSLSSTTTSYADDWVNVTIPYFTDAGDWILAYPNYTSYSGLVSAIKTISKSLDGGVTWSIKYSFEGTSTTSRLAKSINSRNIIGFKDRVYLVGAKGYGTAGKFEIYETADDGETWTVCVDSTVTAWDALHPFSVYFTMASDANGLYLIDGQGNIYYTTSYPTNITDFIALDNTIRIDTNEAYSLFSYSDTSNIYLMTMGRIGVEDGGLTLDTNMITKVSLIKNELQAKAIQISRSKGMAGNLTIEFDNKDGILAPDGETNPALLWPNKEVIVKQGYGTELIQTFKGLIDSISMSTFPQSITINARDKMKALLDHYVRDSSFNYVVTYTAQTVEAIWQDLITKAGLTYGTVETTGITLAEKVFSWESYADAISWLDEIAGFETYCDEFGIMHFVLDGRPETVTVAYEFDEGVDIIQLGYDIDDKDLYYAVVVYGKDANDAVVYYAATLPQAVYWNIPSGKVMRIDAPDADTEAKCQAIADKAIYLMQTRARQVRFSTIGIPHLQRGDFIQVTEASSTISEIYRITDISTSQDSSGYRMELTCYYHAAPEV